MSSPRHRFGSEQHYSYIKDIATSNYYRYMVPFEDDLEKEASYGNRIWPCGNKEVAPEDLLCIAVIGRAVVDYLDVAEMWNDVRPHELSKHNAVLREIENFFHEYDLDFLYDTMSYLCNKSWNVSSFTSDVRRSYGRFMANLDKHTVKTAD